eukprot:CAMPEP_0205824966 /NCGR_PEP_ID=MMETSP0206-20130828/23385_1 /ASSEMBLY_ACC=CAM_ASM_000279 /TAXON_ID=36767 /ORGANISM="Euplotes focardii, Strain TN1" /LENGTH=285 /DNA_ID=CAMNT_0053123575 /DNA_START=25 /DNA_END=879 /DNA_ORIENTATION=-
MLVPLFLVSCAAASAHNLSAGFLSCGKGGSDDCRQKYRDEIATFVGENFAGNFSNLGIVGGDIVSPKDKYPWMTGLRSSRSGASWCGGLLISPTFVLTAAHCRRPVWVSVNTFYRQGTDDGTQVRVGRWITHPEYQSGRYDLQLLELRTAVTGVEPIVLDTSAGDGSAVGTIATAVGWGAIREGGPTSAELREVDLAVVSNQACQEALQRPDRPVDVSMVCAGGVEGQSACHGDSGGPLMNKESRVLIGVVSWGIGCARAGLPGVFGRVSTVRNWIDSVVGDVKW